MPCAERMSRNAAWPVWLALLAGCTSAALPAGLPQPTDVAGGDARDDGLADDAAGATDAAWEVTATIVDGGRAQDVPTWSDATAQPDAEPAADAPQPVDTNAVPDTAQANDVAPLADAAVLPDIAVAIDTGVVDTGATTDVGKLLDGTVLPDVTPPTDTAKPADVAKDVKADVQADTGPPAKPTCTCFVQQAWCGSGVAKEAAKLACTVPLLPAHADDILGCSGGTWIVKENCALGCIESAKGTPDVCKAPPASTCQLKPGKVGPQITWGLHPDASDALRALGVKASGISQTIGDAPASAGYHKQDGVSKGDAYCAATDLKVGGMTQAEIKAFLQDLAEVGFAAWYRKPGYDGWPSNGAPHIHAVWQGAKMKVQLRDQVHSFMAGKNGLTSNTTYTFTTWSACWKSALWKLFVQFNPAKG